MAELKEMYWETERFGLDRSEITTNCNLITIKNGVAAGGDNVTIGSNLVLAPQEAKTIACPSNGILTSKIKIRWAAQTAGNHLFIDKLYYHEQSTRK
jgi:hypothetical protein